MLYNCLDIFSVFSFLAWSLVNSLFHSVHSERYFLSLYFFLTITANICSFLVDVGPTGSDQISFISFSAFYVLKFWFLRSPLPRTVLFVLASVPLSQVTNRICILSVVNLKRKAFLHELFLPSCLPSNDAHLVSWRDFRGSILLSRLLMRTLWKFCSNLWFFCFLTRSVPCSFVFYFFPFMLLSLCKW